MRVARRGLVGVVVASLSLFGAPARADTAPCKGCVLVPPRVDAGPSPLLVTLHGDIDHADTTAAPWKGAIVARGWGLLSIECPVAEGCDKGSFWRWNGPVAWIMAQVKKVTDAYPIDRERLFVSGWSGGASYIGWHAHEIADAFAAIVIHGGGVRPRLSSCPTRTPPVYFLVGSGNPLHDRVTDLHAFFARCHHETVWDLLPHKGHAEELAALDRARADTILTQLEAWTQKPAAPMVPPSAAPAVVPETSRAASSSPSSAPPSTAPAQPPVPAPSAKSARGCATSPREGGGGGGGGVASATIVLVSLARGARRSTRAPKTRAAKLQ